MATLTIRHHDQHRFQVTHEDGRAAGLFEVQSPSARPVEGLPGTNLLHELRWYLEKFLDFPFPPETERAERVQRTLQKWGRGTFNTLFDHRETGSWIEDAIQGGLEQLTLKISSDDPAILAWPWEALEDQKSGTLAQTCKIERRLNQLATPVELLDLPQDRVNVLLVVARPYEADVQYGSIARPLIELVEQLRLPVEVTLLRPPTFQQLDRHLKKRRGYYHLLHFDGHGGYGITAPPSFDHHRYQAQGALVFETNVGKPDPITAEQLSTLLREHHIPAVVLNACRSGMVDDQAEDAFASVAGGLLRAGIRHVVAMSHVVYVSAAQEFLPTFYEQLFATGQFDEAVRNGRRRLFMQQARICCRGWYDLQDWLVPVLYSQGTDELSFLAGTNRAEPSALPEELTDQQDPYGFIGRDGALLQLERAMHRPPPVLLIAGLGGVGKTTLARGFAKWLIRTEGLDPNLLFWFRFDEIHSAEFVFNRMGEQFFGPQFATLEPEKKLQRLGDVFQNERCLIVWDNFEVVHGIVDTDISPKLPPADRELLARFVQKVHNGHTKILLTSRRDETGLWLQKSHRYKLTLSGLMGEDRWKLCETIVGNLGLKVDRKDKTVAELLNLLDGHPLAMRVILPELDSHSAQSLLDQVKQNVGVFQTQALDETDKKLFATLRFVTDQLPEDLKPLLIPIALHERFVEANVLECMCQQVDEVQWTRQRLDVFLHILVSAGVITNRVPSIYELHPLLSRFLRANLSLDETWTTAFVTAYSLLVDHIASKPKDNRNWVGILCETVQTARQKAEDLGMEHHFIALTQFLANHALNTRNYSEAKRLYSQMEKTAKRLENEQLQEIAYHQLGRTAEECREWDVAESWYKKSLEIGERIANETDTAKTYHQLGVIAQGRGEWDTAESWYKKSLEIHERLADEQAALNYHQLGVIAQLRGEFDVAEEWFNRSLQIDEAIGNELGIAETSHQLGVIAQDCDEWNIAENWFKKAGQVFEKFGIATKLAAIYHHLGIGFQARRMWDTAESWYKKSLAVSEQIGNRHSTALTYGQLGHLAQVRQYSADAASWYAKCLPILLNGGDHEHCITVMQNLLETYSKASAEDQSKMRAIWEQAGLRWPSEFDQTESEEDPN